MAAKPVTVNMALARETKNTFRFETDPDAAITTLYVRKDAFKDGKAPEKITVVVNPN